MWVARDKNNKLWLGHCKPKRCGKDMLHPEKDLCQWDFFTNENAYKEVDEMSLNIPSKMFPNLKWEDEPIEVEIIDKQNLKIQN